MGNPIQVDWKALTDFQATFSVDIHNVLAMDPTLSREFKSDREHGTIKMDLAGERFHIDDTFNSEFSGKRQVPPPLRDADLSGIGRLMFDGTKGVLAFNAKVTGSQPKMGPNGNAALEYCVKVRFPQGLLPPGAMLEAQLDKQKPQIEAAFARIPFRDVTIDNENIEIAEKPCPNEGKVYIGFRRNGAPFGTGVVPPENGHWDNIFLKFPTWTKGAGEIDEFSCVNSASTSVTELVANEDAMRKLKAFDKVIEGLRGLDNMSMVFANLPTRPSMMFESAAAMEMNSMARGGTDGEAMPLAAIAGIAGAAGGLAVLAALKLFVKPYHSANGQPLLDHMS